MVKSFKERLVFVIEGDVGNLNDLVQSLDAFLDEFTEADSLINSIVPPFDNDSTSLVFGCR